MVQTAGGLLGLGLRLRLRLRLHHGGVNGGVSGRRRHGGRSRRRWRRRGGVVVGGVSVSLAAQVTVNVHDGGLVRPVDRRGVREAGVPLVPPHVNVRAYVSVVVASMSVQCLSSPAEPGVAKLSLTSIESLTSCDRGLVVERDGRRAAAVRDRIGSGVGECRVDASIGVGQLGGVRAVDRRSGCEREGTGAGKGQHEVGCPRQRVRHRRGDEIRRRVVLDGDHAADRVLGRDELLRDRDLVVRRPGGAVDLAVELRLAVLLLLRDRPVVRLLDVRLGRLRDEQLRIAALAPRVVTEQHVADATARLTVLVGASVPEVTAGS